MLKTLLLIALLLLFLLSELCVLFAEPVSTFLDRLCRRIMGGLPRETVTFSGAYFEYPKKSPHDDGSVDFTARDFIRNGFRGMWIGRIPDCEIRLKPSKEKIARSVSRHHALLNYDDERHCFYVTDAHSENGIRWETLDGANPGGQCHEIGRDQRFDITQNIRLWFGHHASLDARPGKTPPWPYGYFAPTWAVSLFALIFAQIFAFALWFCRHPDALDGLNFMNAYTRFLPALTITALGIVYYRNNEKKSLIISVLSVLSPAWIYYVFTAEDPAAAASSCSNALFFTLLIPLFLFSRPPKKTAGLRHILLTLLPLLLLGLWKAGILEDLGDAMQIAWLLLCGFDGVNSEVFQDAP